jgi:hypothetical protein
MSRAQATADRLLARYGVPVTIVATHPTTGVTSTRTGSAAIVGEPRREFVGAVPVEAGDEELLVTGTAAPEQGARITYADRSRVVARAERIMDRATVAVWRVLARRG